MTVLNMSITMLRQQLATLQKQIDDTTAEIGRMEREFKDSVDPSKVAETAPKLSGIQAWFDKYGQPKPMPDGYVSEFIDNPKVSVVAMDGGFLVPRCCC